MFQFVKQTPEIIVMNGFSVCFELIITWNIFLHFRKLTVKNLNSIFSCFSCVFWSCFFRKSHNFYLGRLGNLAAILKFTTQRIWAEILVVKEPIRELHCHYLVTCVYNIFNYHISIKISKFTGDEWHIKIAIFWHIWLILWYFGNFKVS